MLLRPKVVARLKNTWQSEFCLNKLFCMFFIINLKQKRYFTKLLSFKTITNSHNNPNQLPVPTTHSCNLTMYIGENNIYFIS